jgi:antitoxin VapB
MPATAKVFTTGNSQAVRLPKAFRVNVDEMWISKNEVTGDITLKPKASEDQRQRNLRELFRLIEENPCADDFLPEREISEPRNPFEEWAEPLSPQDPKGEKR